MVSGAVNDLRLRILLDTGATGSMISLDLARRLKLKTRMLPELIKVTGLGGAPSYITASARVKITLGWRVVYILDVMHEVHSKQHLHSFTNARNIHGHDIHNPWADGNLDLRTCRNVRRDSTQPRHSDRVSHPEFQFEPTRKVQTDHTHGRLGVQQDSRPTGIHCPMYHIHFMTALRFMFFPPTVTFSWT
jgi:hypothetical protein